MAKSCLSTGTIDVRKIHHEVRYTHREIAAFSIAKIEGFQIILEIKSATMKVDLDDAIQAAEKKKLNNTRVRLSVLGKANFEIIHSASCFYICYALKRGENSNLTGTYLPNFGEQPNPV